MLFCPLRRLFLSRLINCCLILTFVVSMIVTPKASYAGVMGLPAPGTMVNLSTAYVPLNMIGLTVYPENPLMIDFLLNTGNSNLSATDVGLKNESMRLIKYFLATLATPENDLWVNLSPYEKQRIITDELGKTQLGQDMLEQDYILKQLTASLIYPEKNLGRNFWDTVYAKAQQMYGTTQIPVNTFNKVWILPDSATVYTHQNTVILVQSHLKVMLDEDYLSLMKHSNINNSHSIASNIIRQIVLPAIEKEVNTGANFATLRQIYSSMILATWYRANLKQAFLNQVYTNQKKINGVDTADKNIKEKIYRQYLEAYKKGVFNYIKEETTKETTIARKYFSGGLLRPDPAMIKTTTDSAMIERFVGQQFGDDVQVRSLTPPLASNAMNTPKPIELLQSFEILFQLLKKSFINPDSTLDAFRQIKTQLDELKERVDEFISTLNDSDKEMRDRGTGLAENITDFLPMVELRIKTLQSAQTGATFKRAFKPGSHASAAMNATEMGQAFIDANLDDIKSEKATVFGFKPGINDEDIKRVESLLEKAGYQYQESPVYFTLSLLQVRQWYVQAFATIRRIKSNAEAERDIQLIETNMTNPLRVLILKKKDGGKLNWADIKRLKTRIRTQLLNLDDYAPINGIHISDSPESGVKELGILRDSHMTLANPTEPASEAMTAEVVKPILEGILEETPGLTKRSPQLKFSLNFQDVPGWLKVKVKLENPNDGYSVREVSNYFFRRLSEVINVSIPGTNIKQISTYVPNEIQFWIPKPGVLTEQEVFVPAENGQNVGTSPAMTAERVGQLQEVVSAFVNEMEIKDLAFEFTFTVQQVEGGIQMMQDHLVIKDGIPIQYDYKVGSNAEADQIINLLRSIFQKRKPVVVEIQNWNEFQRNIEAVFKKTSPAMTAIPLSQVTKTALLSVEDLPEAVRHDIQNGVIATESQGQGLKIILNPQVGQKAIFEKWQDPRFTTEKKQKFLDQVANFENIYPNGNEGFREEAMKLIQLSFAGENPLKGKIAHAPRNLEIISPFQKDFEIEQKKGLIEALDTITFLAGGGIGERGGLQGIAKLRTYQDILRMKTYLQDHIKTVLVQQKWGNEYARQEAIKQGALSQWKEKKRTFVIMVSDGTIDQTIRILKENNNFGIEGELTVNPTREQVERGEVGQIVVISQDMYPAVGNTKGEYVLDENFNWVLKPNGSGGFHTVFARTGLMKYWKKMGKIGLFYMQDTNPNIQNALPVALAIAREKHYDAISVTSPRDPGDATGTMLDLEDEITHKIITECVEYNYLKGSVLDKEPYANLNGLYYDIDMLLNAYAKTQGQLGMLLNPKKVQKQADGSSTFTPARPELMAQYGLREAKNVGVVHFYIPAEGVNENNEITPFVGRIKRQLEALPNFVKWWKWLQIAFVFAPAKNTPDAVGALVEKGSRTETSAEAEHFSFMKNRLLLAMAGADVEVIASEKKYLGVPVPDGAKITGDFFLQPFEEIAKSVTTTTKITPRSVMIVDAPNVKFNGFELDGTLLVEGVEGSNLVLTGKVKNAGWEEVSISQDSVASDTTPFYERQRGYKIDRHAQLVINMTEPGDYIFSEGRVYKKHDGAEIDVTSGTVSTNFAMNTWNITNKVNSNHAMTTTEANAELNAIWEVAKKGGLPYLKVALDRFMIPTPAEPWEALKKADEQKRDISSGRLDAQREPIMEKKSSVEIAISNAVANPNERKYAEKVQRILELIRKNELTKPEAPTNVSSQAMMVLPENEKSIITGWSQKYGWDNTVIKNVLDWYSSNAVNDEQRKALLRIIAQGKADKIVAGFSSEKGVLQPGTAGTREAMENLAEDKIGPNFFSTTTVIQYTLSFVNWYKSTGQTGPAFITKEVRENSDIFADVAAKIMLANGIPVIRINKPVSTPFASFLAKWLAKTQYGKPAFGYQISASHNKYADNGIKFMGPDGQQFMPEVMNPIAAGIPSLSAVGPLAEIDFTTNPNYHVLTEEEFTQALNAYFDELDSTLTPEFDSLLQVLKSQGKKFVFTPLNGASGDETIAFLKRHGLELGVDYLIPEQEMLRPIELPAEVYAQKKMESSDPARDAVLALARTYAEANGIDMVLARDPDGDRLVLALKINGEWQKLDGNQNAVVMLHDRLSHSDGLDKSKMLVMRSHATTNLMDKITAAFGIKMVVVPVGFKYFGAKIIQVFNNVVGRYFFGAEESYGTSNGHINEKDGLSGLANMLIIIARQAQQGKTVIDYLNELYMKYGYPGDRIISTPLPGSSKPEQDKARNNVKAALKELKIGGTFAGYEIISFKDKVDVEGLGQFHDGYDLVLKDHNTGKEFRLLFRASGTEAVFKAYFSWREPITSNSLQELRQLISNTEEYVKQVSPRLEEAFKKMAENKAMIVSFAYTDNSEAEWEPIDLQEPMTGTGSSNTSTTTLYVNASQGRVESNLSKTAGTYNGGINLNGKYLNLQNKGEKMNIAFSQAMMAQFRRGDFSGVQIKIIDIEPISLMPMLGLRKEDSALS